MKSVQDVYERLTAAEAYAVSPFGGPSPRTILTDARDAIINLRDALAAAESKAERMEGLLVNAMTLLGDAQETLDSEGLETAPARIGNWLFAAKAALTAAGKDGG